MSADQWSSLTVGNTVALDPAGTGDGWLSQSPRGEWDSLHDIARTWGGNHGDSLTKQRAWISGYVDASNTFITPIAISGGLSAQNTHGFYCGPAIDQQTGDVYGTLAYINNSDVRRYSYATGVWDTPFPSNTIVNQHCSGIAVAYHPGLYGGLGGIVIGSVDGIWSSRLPRSGSVGWNIILDRTNPVDAMDDFPVCAYNRKDACLYIGGGGGSGIRNLWKIPASSGAGTALAVTYPSAITLYEWTSSSNAHALVAAGNAANDMVAIGGDGTIWQYNAVADSWSLMSATVPTQLTNGSTANKWWNLISCPKYGCIIAMQGASNFQTTNSLFAFRH